MAVVVATVERGHFSSGMVSASRPFKPTAPDLHSLEPGTKTPPPFAAGDWGTSAAQDGLVGGRNLDPIEIPLTWNNQPSLFNRSAKRFGGNKQQSKDQVVGEEIGSKAD
jgi:hypothetical protein